MFTAVEIEKATGGKILSGTGDISFKGVSIDSRTVQEGEIFVALKGERFNGNDFAHDAFLKGAAGILTDNDSTRLMERENSIIIRVESSMAALHSLASYNRDKHRVPLVAITGSNGKTTTKEMLASILRKKYEVLKNKGNLNNLIGVPLTLLRLHSDHEIAVVEMGMNREGEIRTLAHLAMPDVGVITNIGEAHLEGLGSLENIKRAKGELLEAIDDEKLVVLNADDEAVMELGKTAPGKIMTFGLNNKADLMASEIEIELGKGILFLMSAEGHNVPVLLPLYGIHQLYNALAAASAAYSLGFDLHEIREGLEQFEPYTGRMQIVEEKGINLINDCYNANPPSVRYALETMSMLTENRKIALLGDMLEMGEQAKEVHRKIGKNVFHNGVDILLTLGPLATNIAEGAIDEGMKRESVISFEKKEELLAYLFNEIREDDWILIKGSRGMRMEEIVSAILDNIKGKGMN